MNSISKRLLAAVFLPLQLAGCVTYWDTDKVDTNPSRYAKSAEYTAGMIFLGVASSPISRKPVTVASCFDKEDQYADRALMLGTNPFKEVCRQYKGVDLTEQNPALKKCFPIENGLYVHPWLAAQPDKACLDFITLIRKNDTP